MTSDLKRARIAQRNLERARDNYLILRLFAGLLVMLLVLWVVLGVFVFAKWDTPGPVSSYAMGSCAVFPGLGMGLYALVDFAILPARNAYFQASDDYEDLLNERF